MYFSQCIVTAANSHPCSIFSPGKRGIINVNHLPPRAKSTNSKPSQSQTLKARSSPQNVFASKRKVSSTTQWVLRFLHSLSFVFQLAITQCFILLPPNVVLLSSELSVGMLPAITWMTSCDGLLLEKLGISWSWLELVSALHLGSQTSGLSYLLCLAFQCMVPPHFVLRLT